VRKVLVRGLERMGYQVKAYGDPAVALAAITAAPSQVDLVLTDFTMPSMTGLELARRLRVVRTDLPVLLYSGDVTTVRELAREAGIREVLEKPVSLTDVGAAMRRAIGGGDPPGTSNQ